MGRYIGPKNKIARRFGVNLGLKSNPTKVARRLSQPPGVHGPKKRPGATSAFGKQLLEKQKAKFIYGLRERQLHKYVVEANRLQGNNENNIMHLLESRFDNVIYRLGFAVTRAQARQFVGHGMFVINGKKMDIPSHHVKTGDIIAVKQTKAKKKIFDSMQERLAAHATPSWLSLDAVSMTAKVTGKPQEMDFDKVFDVQLIIEYYSTR